MPEEQTQVCMEMNLFHMRLMMEHALFIVLAFMPGDARRAREAEGMRRRMGGLLRRAAQMAQGCIGKIVLASGELTTRFTELAEDKTGNLTGMHMDTDITRLEYSLGGIASGRMPPEADVERLNRNAGSLAREFLSFQERLYADVLAAHTFTANTPTFLNHMIEETKLYIKSLTEGGESPDAADILAFWSNDMAEHAQLMQGWLDPAENKRKDTAAVFATEFTRLKEMAEASKSVADVLPEAEFRSAEIVQQMRGLTAEATQGILSNTIRSVALPLFTDHALREANFYFRLLEQMNQG